MFFVFKAFVFSDIVATEFKERPEVVLLFFVDLLDLILDFWFLFQ